jgi:molybdate transport system substrate-binding protein
VRRRHLRLVLAALLTLGFLATSCGADDAAGGGVAATTAHGSAAAPLTGSITVSAAASLTGAFATIRDGFVADNPGADITLNVGSSGTLATQIQEGAPVDLAAFADEANMTTLHDQGLLDGEIEIFAANQLVIVTRSGNPRRVEGLADLATAGTISLCVHTAPCGRFADQVLSGVGASVPESRVTRGPDVKAALSAVTEGDAEAAIVYVTDARAAGDAVATVEIPSSQNAVARYPIAVIAGTKDAALAEAFMAYVLGPEGRTVLEEAGFEAP